WVKVIFIALLVAAVVAPSLALAVGLIGVAVWTVLQVLFVIAAACAAVFRCLRWAQRRFQEAHRRDSVLHEWEQDIAAAQHEAREYRCLESVYRQLVDWSDVVAETTHRPFG